MNFAKTNALKLDENLKSSIFLFPFWHFLCQKRQLLYNDVMLVSEMDFLKECIKKILIKNKWTINNFYHIYGHILFDIFGPLLCTSDQQKKPYTIGDHSMNTLSNLVPIGSVVSGKKITM